MSNTTTIAPTSESCALAWKDLAIAGVGLLLAVVQFAILALTCVIKRTASSTKHSVREGNTHIGALHGLVASLVTNTPGVVFQPTNKTHADTSGQHRKSQPPEQS